MIANRKFVPSPEPSNINVSIFVCSFEASWAWKPDQFTTKLRVGWLIKFTFHASSCHRQTDFALRRNKTTSESYFCHRSVVKYGRLWIKFSSVFTIECTLYDLIDFKLSFLDGNRHQNWQSHKLCCLLPNNRACSSSSLYDCLNFVAIIIQLYITLTS